MCDLQHSVDGTSTLCARKPLICEYSVHRNPQNFPQPRPNLPGPFYAKQKGGTSILPCRCIWSEEKGDPEASLFRRSSKPIRALVWCWCAGWSLDAVWLPAWEPRKTALPAAE